MESAIRLQTICIGVPTFRRPDKLDHLLETLAPLLAARPHVRLSVVNDGSHDAAYERVLAGHDHDWLTYVSLPQNLGCGGARRAAFEGVADDWLVTIDDDCVPSEHWLATLEALVNTDPADFFAGEVRPAWKTAPSPYEEDLACIDRVSSMVVTPYGLLTAVTANLAMRRVAYERAGGFATEMRGAEDCDMTQRLIRSGATYRLCPQLTIDHVAQTRYLPMRRRFRSYGDHAARYVLVREDWRVAARQPKAGFRFFLKRVWLQFWRSVRAARADGYSRWRSLRRAFFMTAMSVHYELAWHGTLRREGRRLRRTRPLPPDFADRFADFG